MDKYTCGRGLTEKLVDLLPPTPTLPFHPLFIQKGLDIHIPPTTGEIHFIEPDKSSLLDYLEKDQAQQDDRKGKVTLEEVFGPRSSRHGSVSDRGKTCPELCDQYQDIEYGTKVGANDTGLRPIRKFIKGMTCKLPCSTETDMANADRCPIEDGCKTRNSKHPVESLGLGVASCGDDVAEKTPTRSKDDCNKRSTRSVDVAEHTRSLAPISKGGECSTRSIHGRVANTENRYENDHVHD